MPDYSPSDIDAWARTIATESDPSWAGHLAVANVVANRMQSGEYGGTSPTAVVRAPNQFEVWSNGRAQNLNPNSPAYNQALKAIEAVTLGGAADNTGGATHFYSPSGQQAMGRNAPAWGRGAPNAAIGGQLFYAPEGTVKRAPSVSSDFLTDFDVAPSGKASSTVSMPPAAVAPANTGGGHDFLTDFEVAPAQAAATSSAPAASPSSAAPPARTYDSNLDTAGAAATGFVNGIPIAGPTLLGGVQKAAAAIRAIKNNTTYSQELDNVQNITSGNALAHPIASTVGGVGGSIAGTVPMMMAAPGAFGLSGAGLAANTVASGATGAVLGAGDSVARNGLTLDDAKRGAFYGGIAGAAAPGIGQAVGAGVNALSNAVSRTTPAARNIGSVLSDIGLTPQSAQSALTRMGPNATLADINPALTAEAGSLAAQGGAPTSILKTAMATRAAGASDRIGDAVDTHLGPRPDITAVQDGIAQTASANAAPYYNASRANPQSMDITPILSNIDARLPDTAGGVKSNLQTARSFLVKQDPNLPGVAIPKDDPQALLGARQALDDMISKAPQSGDTTAGKNAVAALNDVRGQIDKVLKSDPNIAAGDAAYATQMRNLDAVKEGTDLFKPATRIEDVTRSVAGKTPEQVEAMRQGALSSVHDALDNARQGEFAAARSLFGKSEANRAKLDALFPDAGRVFDKLDAELEMRGTEQRVASNSATAERQAIGEKYKPKAPNALDTGSAVVGAALAGGLGAVGGMATKAAWSGARNAFTEAAIKRLNEGTARGLASTGSEQAAFMDQVRRAMITHAATNALSRGGSMAANALVRGGNALAPNGPIQLPSISVSP